MSARWQFGDMTVTSRLGTASVLIIQDALPWSTDSIQLVLENSIEDMLLKIFADGFESGDTTAWSSTVP